MARSTVGVPVRPPSTCAAIDTAERERSCVFSDRLIDGARRTVRGVRDIEGRRGEADGRRECAWGNSTWEGIPRV